MRLPLSPPGHRCSAKKPPALVDRPIRGFAGRSHSNGVRFPLSPQPPGPALGTDAEEALVEEARRLRNNPGPHEHAFVTQFNDMMAVRSTGTDY